MVCVEIAYVFSMRLFYNVLLDDLIQYDGFVDEFSVFYVKIALCMYFNE